MWLADIVRFFKRHACTVLAMIPGILVVLAPAIVATPVLGILGFTTTGISAGSTAAALQSSLGSVTAPCLFSTLQSAAMGGYGVAAVNGFVQGVGAMVATGTAIVKTRKAGKGD
ncbi:hypothetical protein CDD83_7605 [Cordyceps sp. RAO-2017]|nr:hypothetical protein CDD83_7605 [Cordyceps sp. RAO-2017]